MKAIELIALLSTLDPNTPIRTYISPKYGNSYIEDIYSIEKCVTENRDGDEVVNVVLSLIGTGDKIAGDCYPLNTPDKDVRSWADEKEEDDDEYAEAMSVGMLIEKLSQFPDHLLVYTSKYEYVGNVASIHYANEVNNPVSGKKCILLQDSKSRWDAGYSTLESKMTVRDLIEALEQFDSDVEVMMKPRNGAKNFSNVNKVEESTYGFFGRDIPCVLLVDDYPPTR